MGPKNFFFIIEVQSSINCHEFLFTKLYPIETYKITPGTNMKQTFEPFSSLTKQPAIHAQYLTGQTSEFFKIKH